MYIIHSIIVYIYIYTHVYTSIVYMCIYISSVYVYICILYIASIVYMCLSLSLHSSKLQKYKVEEPLLQSRFPGLQFLCFFQLSSWRV